MTLYEDLHGATEVGRAVLAELEGALAQDVPLTLGEARDSVDELVGDPQTRVAAVNATLGDGTDALVALVATPAFAAKLERAAEDELLLTIAGPALSAAVDAIANVASTSADAERPHEADVRAIHGAHGSTIAFPILEEDAPIGALVVVLGSSHDEASLASSTATRQKAVVDHGAQLVLADVEMGITAELGRSTLTIRELLSLVPGTVIDLDRAATSPVDILVNGTVIARGEVVVVDEEFGVRILEIIGR